MISINKIPQTATTTTATTTTHSLPSTYSLTNSSLESNRSYISDQDVVIGEQWLVLSKIGQGSFGEVFEVRDIETGRHYAVKREPRSSNYSQIKHENNFYDILVAGPGIPQCHWYGRHENFDCIIMDLLGVNLKELQQSVKKFPLSIVVDLGCQMIDILEHIHNRGIIYRDVKPENFLFSDLCQLLTKWNDDDVMNDSIKYESCQDVYEIWGQKNPKLYLVDFGLATCWRNLNTKQPYPESKKPIRNKTGTARYASIHVHQGKTPSRRDDMESLGYLLIDLASNGLLPWNGIQARSCKVGWEKIRKIKEEIKTKDLCAGLPREWIMFIDYTKKLQFYDEPDYDYLRQLLKASLNDNRHIYMNNNNNKLNMNTTTTSNNINNNNNKMTNHKDDIGDDQLQFANNNSSSIKSNQHYGTHIKNETTTKQYNNRHNHSFHGYKKESRTETFLKNNYNYNNYNHSKKHFNNNNDYNKNDYKSIDDVFIMDDITHELQILSDNKKEANGKSLSQNNINNNGRRRRNSRKSSWGNGGTKHTPNQRSNNNNNNNSRSLSQYNNNNNNNNNSNNSKQNYFQKQNNFMKLNDSSSKNQELVEPWNKYITTNKQQYHHHHHHQHHHYHHWQQQSSIS